MRVRPILCTLLLLILAAPAVAGGLHGEVKLVVNAKGDSVPFGEGCRVVAVCGDQVVGADATNKQSSYRVTVDRDCKLSVHVEMGKVKSNAVTVAVKSGAWTRCNLLLEREGDRWVLTWK